MKLYRRKTTTIGNVEKSEVSRCMKYYCNKYSNAISKKDSDRILGEFLESLVRICLRHLGYRVQIRKTRGIDIVATYRSRRRSKCAIEVTNWAPSSYFHPNYFSSKIQSLWGYFHNSRCCWIISYDNFPVSMPFWIEKVVLGMQFIPCDCTLQDYLHLKKVLKQYF